jgi:hypothetical protein
MVWVVTKTLCLLLYIARQIHWKGRLQEKNAFLLLVFEGSIGQMADLAGGSLLRSGQMQVGEPKIGEHAQWHYFASVATQTLRW